MSREKQAPIPLSYSELAERQFIQTPEAYTLMASVREDMPVSEKPERLFVLASKMSGLYATFMGKLTAGSSFRAASMSCGLNPHTVRTWLEAGAHDLHLEQDTLCSRFLLDCQRAAAVAVSDAEERVFKKDPDKWLSKGPARDFHRGRYWKEIGKADEQEALENDPDNPLDPPVAIEEAAEDQSDDTADKDLSQALKVLEHHQIITSPEFVEQAKNQYKVE
jgi:hypothetical protein